MNKLVYYDLIYDWVYRISKAQIYLGHVWRYLGIYLPSMY